MRSLKKYLVLGLAILLIGFNFSCKSPASPIDNGNGNTVRFVNNVEIIYERPIPFGDLEYLDSSVWLDLGTTGGVDGWSNIQNQKMEKTATDKFKYVASTIPVNIYLHAIVQDFSQDDVGGVEFNARIIKVNGTELTNIGADPCGNTNKAAYFKIDETGTVVPETEPAPPDPDN